MAPAQTKHHTAAPCTVPWSDEILFHADVGPELHAHLTIKPLVALIGTCKAAGAAIAFKPAKARAELAKRKGWLCRYAACWGDLRLLEWAHAQGCPWGKRTCKDAAKNGHLHCLKYAHEQGCEWDEYTCKDAAKNGHLHCLTYAHEQGCPWGEGTCKAAAKNGHLHCLTYAHEQGCQWDGDTTAEWWLRVGRARLRRAGLFQRRLVAEGFPTWLDLASLF